MLGVSAVVPMSAREKWGIEELKNELISLNNNKSISVIILTGAGKAFTAGIDLRQIEENGTDISSGGVGKTLDRHF